MSKHFRIVERIYENGNNGPDIIVQKKRWYGWSKYSLGYENFLDDKSRYNFFKSTEQAKNWLFSKISYTSVIMITETEFQFEYNPPDMSGI